MFTLCNHHKEYHFCEMNLYGVCYNTVLSIVRVECCSMECVCMCVWDRLHLCCEMNDGIIDHVCACALRGISEHFGDRLGSTVAGLCLLSKKTAHQRTNLHAVHC